MNEFLGVCALPCTFLFFGVCLGPQLCACVCMCARAFLDATRLCFLGGVQVFQWFQHQDCLERISIDGDGVLFRLFGGEES